MKALPQKIRVGYQDIIVTEEEGNMVEGLGVYHTEKHTITLKKKQTRTEKSNTMLHEVLHAVWHTQGLRTEDGAEERVINSLTNGLHQVLRDNPALVAWLLQEIRSKA